MFTFAFLLVSLAPHAAPTAAREPTAIVASHMIDDMICSTPRALSTDPSATVRTCEHVK